MSDLILLTLIRQLLRRGLLSDMDIQAMAADLERDGYEDAAHSVNLTYIEASALEVADGGNDTG